MYSVSIMLALFQHPYLCLQEAVLMMFFHYPKETVVKGERVLDEAEHTVGPVCTDTQDAAQFAK